MLKIRTSHSRVFFPQLIMSFMEICMHKTSLGKRIPYKITLWLLFRIQILCLFIRVFTYCLHVLWGKYASFLKNTPQTHLKHTSFVFGVPKNTARSSLKRWEMCVSSMSSIEILWVAIIKIRHNDFKRKKREMDYNKSRRKNFLPITCVSSYLQNYCTSHYDDAH